MEFFLFKIRDMNSNLTNQGS